MTFTPKAIEAACEAFMGTNDLLGKQMEVALSAALAVDGVALQGWQPIESAPKDTLKVCSETLLLAHADKKWIRFGKWYVQERCWYYSGTNERSKYAQVRGDDPTHWQPLPQPPAASDQEERRLPPPGTEG